MNNETSVKPLLAIRCLAYNQVKYIRQTLDGFVSQQTDFPFIAIVHDDASTDGTADIIREYAEKYPDIIKPIFQTENIYSNKNRSLRKAVDIPTIESGAKYVAFCEGDDYWTDPKKLQKQVDYLEKHPDVIYTCHRYLVQNGNEDLKTLYPNIYLDRHTKAEGFKFDLDYAFKCDFVTKTLTAVFRIEGLTLKDLRGCSFFRDTHLVYQMLERGNGYCFQFTGGVYRKQPTGVWSQQGELIRLNKELITWEDIKKVKNNRLSKALLRKFYMLHFRESLKQRKLPQIRNFEEFKALFHVPSQYLKMRDKTIHKTELKRIEEMNE